MGRLHPFSFILAVLIGIICLIMAVFSYAEDNIDREIKYWLRKAEEHANNIIDPNERDLGLFLLAAAHVHAENYEKAHSIVSEIDESKRKNYWPVSLMIQARAGDIQGAVKKAQTFKDQEIRSHCMYSVMYECIKKNIPYALEVIEKQPKPDQCSLYYMVVQEQVLQGKLEEARKTFRKISDPNSKSDANNWILTGQIVEQDDLAVAIAQAKNFTENPRR